MLRGLRALAGAALLVGWSGCAMTPAREVTLVARGMAFALAGEPEMLNPP